MKNLFRIALLALAAAASAAQAGDRVLMFIADGSRDLDLMLTREVGVMRAMLEDAGYTVEIATATGAPMRTERAAVTPTVALEDVSIADYAGIILPCMAPAAGTPQPPEIDVLVRRAHDAGIPVAASRGSVGTLARAGALDGREYAYAGSVDVAKRPEFAGGTFLGTGVVRDGSVVTAGICPLAARELGEPDGTEALTIAFIEALDERS